MTIARSVIHASDFLELLISFLPPGEKYSCDIGIWSQAVFILRERHEGEHRYDEREMAGER